MGQGYLQLKEQVFSAGHKAKFLKVLPSALAPLEVRSAPAHAPWFVLSRKFSPRSEQEALNLGSILLHYSRGGSSKKSNERTKTCKLLRVICLDVHTRSAYSLRAPCASSNGCERMVVNDRVSNRSILRTWKFD